MDGDPAERFRLIAETITEVFWMATPDLSRVLYVSPAFERLWGRSVETVYRDPRSFLEAIHPEDRERIERNVDARSDGHSFDHEYRIVDSISTRGTSTAPISATSARSSTSPWTPDTCSTPCVRHSIAERESLLRRLFCDKTVGLQLGPVDSAVAD